MKRLPPLKALQAFRIAAENSSFKLAAEQLYVTQAAISQQIKGLEQQLGVTLFKRLTREIELTDEGLRLLPYVQKGLISLEQGLEALGSDPTPDHLNLTTLPSFAGRWLMPRLNGFQQQYPGINISLIPSIQFTDFGTEKVDLAIRYGSGNYPGLESRLLAKDHLVLVCNPSLIDDSKPVTVQIRELPLIADDTPECQNDQIPFRRELELDFENPRLLVTDATMQVEALIAGQGIGVARFSLVYELLNRGQLICPLKRSTPATYSYYLVAPEHHFQREKVKLFEQWIRTEIEVLESSWQRFNGRESAAATDQSSA